MLQISNVSRGFIKSFGYSIVFLYEGFWISLLIDNLMQTITKALFSIPSALREDVLI